LGGRSGGGIVGDVAGWPQMRVKSSNPAGVTRMRKRAWGDVTSNRCSTRRGPKTKEPGPGEVLSFADEEGELSVDDVPGLVFVVVEVLG